MSYSNEEARDERPPEDIAEEDRVDPAPLDRRLEPNGLPSFLIELK